MAQNAILNVTDGNQSGSWDLGKFNKSVITIGRSKDCDIQLNNPKVSGHHGQFYNQNGYWFYQDNNSTNGTIVNGKKVQQVNLNSGDVMIFDTVPGVDSLRIDVNLMQIPDQFQQNTPPGIYPDQQFRNGVGENTVNAMIGNAQAQERARIEEAKAKKKKIAIISILSVILIAAIVVTVLIIVKKKGPNGSAEKCAVNFVEGLAERDTAKMKKSMHPQMAALAGDLFNSMDELGSVTIENIKAGSVRNSSDESTIKNTLKGTMNIDVDDVKIVNVKYTMSMAGQSQDVAMDVTCFKTGSDWYVYDFDD